MIPIIDYIPCDLERYSQEILPIWRQAQSGNIQPVQDLIQTASHISLWPIFNIPNPLPDKHFAGPRDVFRYYGKTFWPNFFPTQAFPESFRNDLLQEIEEQNELDFWSFCLQNLPTLVTMPSADMCHQPGAFLLNCVFFTFCCQLPAEQLEDALFIGNEDYHFWHNYLSRDAESRELWSLFDQPAPQPFADQVLFPQSYQEYLAEHEVHQHVWRHRDLFSQLDGMNIMEKGGTSFLTYEECVYLLHHLRTQAKPPVDITIDRCVHRGRWKKEWPVPAHLIQIIQEDMPHGSVEWKTWTPEYLQVIDHWSPIDYWLLMDHWYSINYWPSKRDALPDMDKLIYECWMQEHPEEMQAFAQEYYQSIWSLEAKVVERVRYAVSLGWGLLMIN